MASVTDDPASSASCGPLSAGEIAALAADFPHFEHAFVYGSALVAPASGSIPMTDLVFAVREAEAWHALNLEKHAAHYSPLGMLGPLLPHNSTAGFSNFSRPLVATFT